MKLSFGWLFSLAAALIMIFGMDIVWWQAILVLILASFDFKIEWS